MSGQSVMDRVIAAKHSIAGSGLAKSVCKATTEELIGPKKKHLDYLVHCTNEPNVSIPQMADLLIERTQHANWVVVFKSLITIHNLMNYGNERFSQYFASNNCSFNLGSFMDKGGVHGYDMSTFVRRYAKYLNVKSVSYRTVAYDFCKVKRGKDDGLLRKMNTEKLLKTLPPLQTLVDALLEFDCTPNELTNGVINACFMLLFKDLIRLFACYNDGIINLLEKYFEMNKKHCKEALDIYKKFLIRMDKVSEFLKVAENVGIDKGDIPDLAKAPSSLLEALEEHHEFLENKKGTGVAPAKSAAFTTALNSMSSNNFPVSEDEKNKILIQENQQFEEFKKQKDLASPTTQVSTNPFLSSPVQTQSNNVDLFGAPIMQENLMNGTAAKSSDDLLTLSTNPFQSSLPDQNFSSPWENAITDNKTNDFTTENSFAAVFGEFQSDIPQKASVKLPPGFDSFGDVLQPQSKQTLINNQSSVPQKKLIQNDLDTSMMQLAGSLSINTSDNIKRTEHQWQPRPMGKKTGGTTWQQPMTASSTWAAPGPYNQPPAMGMQRMMYSMTPGLSPMGAPMQYSQGMNPGGMNMGMGMANNPMVPGMAPMPGYQQPMMRGAFPQQQGVPQQSNINDPFGAL